MKSGDLAEIITNKINNVAGDTGVEAVSSTQAMLSFENTNNTNLNDTVSFNLYGIDGTMKHISSKINFGSGNQDMDLGPLRTEINNFSSQTGITAYISDDKQAITLKTRQGFDILIEDFNLKNDTNNVFMYLNEMKSSGQVSPSSLKLSQSSSGVNANDSGRIFGEVILKSHKHFSLNSTQADSILSLREKNLDFVSLSTIAARSFETAKKSIDVIKFSMKSIAAEQSKVGGLANQLQETVRALSHIRSLDQIAIGKIEDVDVAKTVVFPEGITPNGDGLNDNWVIRLISEFPRARVMIFNRWGQKVFESVGYSDSWDGTQNGRDLPVGTYYYVIDLANEDKVFKGTLTIIR